MKKRLLSFNFLLLVSYCGFSQSVGIGTTAPDASAVLDIIATNRGLLIPGMNMSSIIGNAEYRNICDAKLAIDCWSNNITGHGISLAMPTSTH